MTNEQKFILRRLAIFMGFKVVFYAGIFYSAKQYRKRLMESYHP